MTPVPSAVEKRSLVVGTAKTSISLEQPFWMEFRRMAHERDIPLSRLAAEINAKPGANLSSKIRMTVLAEQMKKARRRK